MVYIRIITWNCNGKFRAKWEEIAKYAADIYVIQECENPETISDMFYQQFASNCKWKGNLQYKGLGIFASKNVDIEICPWNNHLLRHFLPVKINKAFTLLAVWACAPYIEEYAVYQDIHFHKFDKDMVIAGDFNSNKIWDAKRIYNRSHSGVVEKLDSIGLSSAYHVINEENHGEETQKTFYLHRKTNYKKSIEKQKKGYARKLIKMQPRKDLEESQV